MRLETKAAAIAGTATLAVLAICQVEPVIIFFATAIAGGISWYIGYTLAPDESVQGDGFNRRPDGTYEFKDNSHRNYEDF